MMKCILVDDEPLALAQLKKYTDDIPFLECVKACSNATEAMAVLQEENIDVAFVDINIPDMDGLQLVRSLVAPPMIVFTTAYAEYAVEAFRLNVVDYLLKPFSFDDFMRAAGKVYELYNVRKKVQSGYREDCALLDECIFVKSDYKILRIPVANIKYVESMSEYVRIYVEGWSKAVVSLISMKKIEDILPSNMFMRVHRSFIINMNKIVEVTRMRIVCDGDLSVPIGEMYKEKFFEFIEKHFVGKGN